MPLIFILLHKSNIFTAIILLWCCTYWNRYALWLACPDPSTVLQWWWQRHEEDQSHPNRFLSPLPPVPSGISSFPSMCACVCTSVMSIRLFVFLHVCLSLHLLPSGYGPVCQWVCIYLCVCMHVYVCSLFQHVYYLRESYNLELEYVLMSVSV